MAVKKPTAQVIPTPHNTEAPYNRFAKTGNPNDTATYMLEPGKNFLRPWIRIPGGPTYVWPLGVEGFDLSIDPTLGIHKYIGDNAVEVNVTHLGEEHFVLTGTFPGVTAPANMRALRDILYKVTPPGGKILYVPILLTYAQRVVIGPTKFSRDASDIGLEDLSYSMEFIRIGVAEREDTPLLIDAVTQPVVAAKAKGKSSRTFTVNSKVNTLMKISLQLFKTTARWQSLYTANEQFFVKRVVPYASAPTYVMPNGTKVTY